MPAQGCATSAFVPLSHWRPACPRRPRKAHVSSNRQAKTVGGADRPHGDNFGGGALAISHMLFADLFADGDDNAFPADHRSESERECDRKLHPVRNEFS